MSRNSRTVQVRNKYSRTEGLLCFCAAKGDSASLPGTEDLCRWCSFLGCYSSCICIPSLAKIYWILEEYTFRLRFCLSSVYLESVWITLFINQITFSEKNAVASTRGPCCWNICTIGRRLSAGKSVEKIHLMRQGYLRIGDNYPNTSLFVSCWWMISNRHKIHKSTSITMNEILIIPAWYLHLFTSELLGNSSPIRNPRWQENIGDHSQGGQARRDPFAEGCTMGDVIADKYPLMLRSTIVFGCFWISTLLL